MVIRQPARRLLSGCRILPGYPTTHKTFTLRLSDSSWLSDNSQSVCSQVVGFFRVIRQPARRLLSGCRILPGYPTTHRAFALRLSDSSGLSDNSQNGCSQVVGFFRVIRQLTKRLLSGCRILPGYPTTHRAFALRLSDSLRLSDNSQNVYSPVVGFFRVIRQLTKRLLSGCRILLGYPTNHRMFALRLSDSLRLSDNSQSVCSQVVGFFRVIRQLTERLLSGCRILPGYPTTHRMFALRLSDSSWLSGNSQSVCSPVVGFFWFIRQPKGNHLYRTFSIKQKAPELQHNTSL